MARELSESFGMCIDCTTEFDSAFLGSAIGQLKGSRTLSARLSSSASASVRCHFACKKLRLLASVRCVDEIVVRDSFVAVLDGACIFLDQGGVGR